MSYEITPERERELLRLLTGEASPQEVRTLRVALEREPDLAERFARLRETWDGLELPEPEPASPGFSHRVLARLPEEPGGVLGLVGAPAWARAMAALALILGLATGFFLGEGLDATSVEGTATDELVLFESEPGLADDYRLVLYGGEDAP